VGEDCFSYQKAQFIQIQHGVVPIPKSSNKQRLEENINIFDFELTPKEVAYIDSVNKNFRIFLFEK
jgi:diketogulonate reductase-like aldo/keto reductase